ncbi:MAG: DUF3015 family protein [SAR324 cluster bacterium]|nr:DUF3015 family protein [SAR324 cluster bacterium]MBL7035987.1 DUF3015 family protein [SAR324 cluster bacterium]
MKKGTIFRLVFAFLFLATSEQFAEARHKCPKVPAPPGILGVFSSITLIPSGSTMAAARSSATSGCERGHPSTDFYTPKKKRITLFLEDNLLQVSEESAQGQGPHLEALTLLAGCHKRFPDFGVLLQKNYTEIFSLNKFSKNEDEIPTTASQTSERLLNLLSDSGPLAASCGSG